MTGWRAGSVRDVGNVKAPSVAGVGKLCAPFSALYPDAVSGPCSRSSRWHAHHACTTRQQISNSIAAKLKFGL